MAQRPVWAEDPVNFGRTSRAGGDPEQGEATCRVGESAKALFCGPGLGAACTDGHGVGDVRKAGRGPRPRPEPGHASAHGHSGSVLASSCGQESGGGREVRRAVRTPAATHPPAGAGKTPRHGDPVCKGSLGEVIVINSRSLIPKGFAPSEARCTGGGRRPGSPLHSSPAQIADAVCAEAPRTRQGRSLSRPFSPSEGGVSS